MFRTVMDYLIMAACVFLMVLLLVMTNPSSTIDLQKIFDINVIKWSKMELSSAIDHLRESHALIRLPSDNRHHYS
jgi:hypothetical protein